MTRVYDLKQGTRFAGLQKQNLRPSMAPLTFEQVDRKEWTNTRTEQNWHQPLFKGGQCICLRPRISAGGSWGFPLASCQVTTLYFLFQLSALQYKCTVGQFFFVNSVLTIIVSGQQTRWWSCSPAREQIQGWERHSWTPLKIIKLELFPFHLNEIA